MVSSYARGLTPHQIYPTRRCTRGPSNFIFSWIWTRPVVRYSPYARVQPPCAGARVSLASYTTELILQTSWQIHSMYQYIVHSPVHCTMYGTVHSTHCTLYRYTVYVHCTVPVSTVIGKKFGKFIPLCGKILLQCIGGWNCVADA
jgi:hypothetical protein